jgi:hypothetical protein
MMTPEQFTQIAEAVEAGTTPPVEDVKLLVDAVRRLDTLMFIFQNGLELLASNVADTMPQLAQQVQARCGRTEQKTTKAVAELAATSVAMNDQMVQGYITTAMFAAATHLNTTIEDLLGVSPEEAPVPQAPQD